MFGGSSNPALSAFEQKALGVDALGETRPKTMTLRGTVIASASLLSICVGAAIISWTQIVDPAIAAGNLGALMPWLFGSMIGGLVLSLVCIFAKKTSPFVGPIYAAAEGVFVSTVSAVIMAQFLGRPDDFGLVFQAITITFGIFAGMLIAYGSGLIKAGGVIGKMFGAAMIGLLLYVAALWIGNGLFGLGIPNLYASTSPLGIGFSVLVVALASYSLVIDFEIIKHGVSTGQPKYMEWYAGVGLLISLVWLYIEVLRLLAKLRSSD